MAHIPLSDLNDLLDCHRAHVVTVEFADRTFGDDPEALRVTLGRRLRGPRSITVLVDDMPFQVRAAPQRIYVTATDLAISPNESFWDVLDLLGLTFWFEQGQPATISVPAGTPLDGALHTVVDAYEQWIDAEDDDPDDDEPAAEDELDDLDDDAAWWPQHRQPAWAHALRRRALQDAMRGGLPVVPEPQPPYLPSPATATAGSAATSAAPEQGPAHVDHGADEEDDDGAGYATYMRAYLDAQRTDRYRAYLAGLHDLDDPTLARRVPANGRDLDEWRRTVRDRSRATPAVGPADFTADVVAHHEARTAAREAAVADLQAWVRGLDRDGTARLLARLEEFIEEEQVPTRPPAALLAGAIEKVLAGPEWPGQWDPGTSPSRWVGWLLLLAVDHCSPEVDGLTAGTTTLVPPRRDVELPVAGAPQVLLGRVDGELQTHPVRKGFVVRTGPAGTGKTSTARAAHLAWDGPSITFTIRPSELTPGYVSLLLEKGPVHLLNATDQRVVLHPDVQRLRWSPLQLVSDWDSAVFVAHVLLSAVAKTDLTDGAFWDNLARCALGPLLYVAAQHPDRYTMRDVAVWTTAFEISEAEVMGLLARAGCEAAATGWAGVMRQDPRTKSSIFATAQTAINSYWYDRVNAVCCRPTFDADEFLASNGTVLVLADGLRSELTTALYTTFLDHLITARKQASADPSHPAHDHLLYLDVDEAGNVVRLPALAALCTTAGGFGIAGSIVLHDHSQAVHRWGALAPLFINSAGARVIYPGTAPSEITRCAGELAPTGPIGANELLVSRSMAEPPERMDQVRDWDDPAYVSAARRAMVLQDPRNHLWGRPRPALRPTEGPPPPPPYEEQVAELVEEPF